MTSHDRFTDRLSEYLDGELEARERDEVDRHLAGCAACRDVLDDLRRIVGAAPRMPAAPPQAELWDGIAGRIAASQGTVVPFAAKTPRRVSFTVPQLAAAGIALMVMSGSMVYLAQSGNSRADFPALTAEAPPSMSVSPVSLADPQYENAVADLEEALEAGRDRLDPETVKVLEKNLDAIDKAIEQCRRALVADPANSYLNSHLVSARQRKLALLRRATALTTGS